jgi:GTP-binding protein
LSPVVAIIGRPNVGKSALFNRIVQKRVSIVEDIPGVTRDRIVCRTDWNGKPFTLVDTGGLVADGGDELANQVRLQVEAALSEADLVLLVVDARAGVLPSDRDAADIVRRAGTPTILVVNKAEGIAPGVAEGEASELGFDEPAVVSAAHGIGIGDLLDRVVALLPESGGEEGAGDRVRVAVVGRPNVGKSSLLNCILGEPRLVVSAEPGTTRDAVDVPFETEGRRFVLVDTAGIRRWGRIERRIEKYSVTRAFRAVDRSDVTVLVMSAEDGVTDQDRKIGARVHARGKGLVLCFNKWDLVDPGGSGKRFREEFVRLSRWRLGFAPYAPVVFTSAVKGSGIERLTRSLALAAAQHSRRVATADLNRVLRDAFALSPPPSEKGKQLRLFYATQAGVRPPFFVLFVNRPEMAQESYARYLEDRIRESFGFEGTPLILKFRERR